MKAPLSKKIAVFIIVFVLFTSLLGCTVAQDQSSTDQTSEASQEGTTTDTQESGAPQEEIALTFWHCYSQGEGSEEETLLNEVIPAFESANPGITINAVRYPMEGLQQEVVTAVAGGGGPDVMRMDATWVAGMADLGALKPLSGFEGFEETMASVLAAPMATNLYQGEYYGLPINTTCTTAVWNMDLLAEFGVTEPPTTIDELVALARVANNPDEQKWVFTIAIGAEKSTWGILPWFWSLGGQISSEDFSTATGYLNSEASVAALETIASWYADGVINGAILGEEPNAWGGITGGNYAMITEGPWFFPYYGGGFEATATTMLTGAGGGITVIGGEDVVMMSTTQQEEAAWKFMQYLLSEEAQLAMSKTGMIPTVTSALNSMDTSAAPYLVTYITQLENTRARIPSENWTLIDKVLADTFQLVISGEATAQEALDSTAAMVDALLN